MDEVLRRLFQPEPDDPVEQDRLDRLCRGDVDALMELFDDYAALAYGWALLLTESRRQAIRIVRSAFLAAARDPQVFSNRRVSCRGWILLEVHQLAWASRQPIAGPAERRSRPAVLDPDAIAIS